MDSLGFWKIYCTLRRKRRYSFSPSERISCPLYRTIPDVGCCRSPNISPKVDFPLPLSPTTPRVCPEYSARIDPLKRLKRVPASQLHLLLDGKPLFHADCLQYCRHALHSSHALLHRTKCPSLRELLTEPPHSCRHALQRGWNRQWLVSLPCSGT